MSEINQIRALLAAKQLLVVAGTGVTAAATKGAPTASWVGLIKHGVQKAVDLHERDAAWAARAEADAESDYESDLIAAAEKATAALGGRTAAEYQMWLRDAVGSLTAIDTELLDGIKSLHRAGALVTTTNYDDLLEKHLGVNHVTWRNGPMVQHAARDGEEVIHLHGHWTDSESVVFGSASYADVMRDSAAIAFLRAMVYTQSMLFVGFGAGLRDPNFGALREWMADALKGSTYKHYRLVRSSEVAAVQAEHGSDNVVAVSFGDDYDELGPFLSSLAVPVTAGATRGIAAPGGDGSGVRTGRPLPVKRDDVAAARLAELALHLQDLVAIADSDDAHGLKLAGTGERLDAIRRFVTVFDDEIESVLVVAQRPDQYPDTEVGKALEWAIRLESIVATGTN